jgi:hypothetical protein
MGLRRTVIDEFAPRSRAAKAYRSLWSEVRERLALSTNGHGTA